MIFGSRPWLNVCSEGHNEKKSIHYSYRWEEKIEKTDRIEKDDRKIRGVEKDTYCTVNYKKDTDRKGFLQGNKKTQERQEGE